MIFRKIFLSLWMFMSALICRAQQMHPPDGAASAATSISSTLVNPWSFQSNIGAFAFNTDTGIGSTVDFRYGLPELSSGGILITLPFRTYSAGLYLSHFGDKRYNEQSLAVGIAHKINHAGIGLKTEYYQISSESNRTVHTLIFDAGGFMSITPVLSIGASLRNIGQSGYQFANARIIYPVVMNAGIRYEPNKKIAVMADAVKESIFPMSLNAGLEYHPADMVKIRAGLITQPRQFSFGVGFQHRLFFLDYSYLLNPAIGSVQQFSFLLRFHAKLLRR